MATTQAELDLVFQRIGTEFKALRTLAGLLANLSTSDKTSLVAAINEVNAKTANAGAAIDDAVARGTTVYSSSKVESLVATTAANVKSEILGGAGPTIDTLKEIADLLSASDTADDNALAALTTAVANRVRFDAAQTLDSTQKQQANDNIGSLSLVQFGDPTHSYKTVFEAALV